jgi:hypothetical protein
MNNYLKPLFSKLFGSIFIVCFIALPVAMASDSERHQQVNGMDIYFGVIPSQLAAGDHPGMHGINAPGSHVYHVLVALFDSKTGNRIKNAKVSANVSDSALTEKSKLLDIMHTNGIISYGNFFRMSVAGRYNIRVEIQHPGADGIAAANFIYQRPRD